MAGSNVSNNTRVISNFFTGKLSRLHGNKYREYNSSSQYFVSDSMDIIQESNVRAIEIEAIKPPRLPEDGHFVEQVYQGIMFEENHTFHKMLQRNSDNSERVKHLLEDILPEAFINCRKLGFKVEETIKILDIAISKFSLGIGSDLTYIESLHIFYVLEIFFGVRQTKGNDNRSRFDNNSLFDVATRLSPVKLSRNELISLLFMKLNAGWFTSTSPFDSYLFGRLRDKLGINIELVNVARSLGLVKDLACLLNYPNLPAEIKDAILPLAIAESERRWEKYDGKHHVAIKTAAEIVARKAYWIYNKVKDVLKKRRKPTLTIYNLSTAYVLCAEEFSDQFRRPGMTDEQVSDKIGQFERAVKEKRKEGKTPIEARFEIGKEWLDSGQLVRFSVPIFLKHSGHVRPNQSLINKLKEISYLANKYNLDVIFIDRGNDDVGTALHQLISFFSDKNRLRRFFEDAWCLELLEDDIDLSINNSDFYFLFRKNNWDMEPIKESENPAFIALNEQTEEEYYYDGRSFRFGGRRGDRYYLPTEDRPELVGCYWPEDGRKEYHDHLILLQNEEGEYRATSSRILFNQYYRAELRRLKDEAGGVL